MENEFEKAVIDLFYDAYFKGKEGHEYTDEEITMSATKGDIDKCASSVKSVLYKHFGIHE